MGWPARGGSAVGLGGLIEQRARDIGYDAIADRLGGHLAETAVLLILGVEAPIGLDAPSPGTSGGVLAPLLILGGAMGRPIGTLLPGNPGFPGPARHGGDARGGTIRAPLTGDVHALPARLAASAAACAVTVLRLKRSILTETIAPRGQPITREYGIDPHEFTRVKEVMVREVDTLPGAMPVPEAVAVLETGRHRIDPVGLVSRSDALLWRTEGGHEGERLGERVSDAALAVVHADDVTAHAIDPMLATGQGRLPVTDPESGRLVGLLTRKDLLQVRAAFSRAEGERQAYFARRTTTVRSAGAENR